MRVDAVNPSRQFHKFADFRGVDYSSSPLEVQPNRASDMANLILRDGTLHKRNGFEQLYYLGEDGNDVKGAWVMKDFTRTKDILVYIIGQNVYEYNITDREKTEGAIYIGTNITDRTMGFVSGNDLYILCGEYLKWSPGENENSVINLIGHSSVYIPTTTTNIVRVNSKLEYKERLLLDSINGLTQRRINKLVWEVDAKGETSKGGNYFSYKLDGEVSTKEAPVIRVYHTGNPYKPMLESGFTLEGGVDWNINDKDYSGIFIRYDTLYIPIEVVLYGEYTGDIYIEFTAVNEELKTHNNKPITPSVSSVEPCGAIFGNDGRADRLFIASGNFVRYTDNTDEYLPNFTYLPVNTFVRCGTNGKITAMMRLANGSLAVFKDSDNDQEPSLYYITGRTIEAYSDETGNVGYDDLFNVQAGNIQENCPTPSAIATLAGDSLFVSPSGVYGIELSGNVAADDRFARMRSRVINTKLTKFDLSKAKTIVYDNRYYVAVGGENNEVFVADSRYKYTTEGDMSNTYNYEWFRWTDVPVSSWLIKDNELWFISKDNYLCRFTDDYADKYLTSQGEETVEGGRVTFAPSLLPIVQRALYAEYNGKRYAIDNLKEYDNGWAFDIPLEDGVVELSFVVPIKAYWQSAVTDLGSSLYRKNMYSMSVTAQAEKQSEVSVGYITRLGSKTAFTAEGVNTFDFDDISFEEYGKYQFFSFDAGGFINAYRKRVFERNFVYAQLFFSCNSIGDCVVEEISVEYTITRKNIGVG